LHKILNANEHMKNIKIFITVLAMLFVIANNGYTRNQENNMEKDSVVTVKELYDIVLIKRCEIQEE